MGKGGRTYDLGTDRKGWAALGGRGLEGVPAVTSCPSLLGSLLPLFLGHLTLLGFLPPAPS